MRNGSISNIYEIQDLQILKINTDSGKKNLIIKSDSRINLTDYDYPIPEFPSQYIRTIRKFMKNRQIVSISQYKFDRIIIIELTNYEEGTWKLVVELFGLWIPHADAKINETAINKTFFIVLISPHKKLLYTIRLLQ